MALNLFGVTVNDAHTAHVQVEGIERITVRDLAAICGTVEYRKAVIDAAAVTRHSEVITAYALRGPVLPAPAGVVFRTAEGVTHWLELHSGAISEALTFVENRVAARVHISRVDAPEAPVSATDIDASAAESLRALRAAAVATLPMRADRSNGVVLTAAFLIEQDTWEQFAAEVDAQAARASGTSFSLTGPWPPYDFVQMQFGS
ncbi:MAG: GvpL/GvpF family gas vesicle protein [Gemmatimonadota bacterium]|nr:GvpL/GvpF family gas vesicle protein [Gemmatimonadota bacterium]